MKTFKKIIISIVALAFIAGCNEGIDPITQVNPGTDQSAPVITISNPIEGVPIQKPEVVSSIVIQFEATDDIELGSVKVLYDGTEIASYSDFKDYRRLIVDTLKYKNVVNGIHKITISATDLGGKTTKKEVNFEKSAPYTPKYAGEVFYMPFNEDYMDMISFKIATVVGTPGFSSEKVVGAKSYAGAAKSYLTFPTNDLKSSQFTAVFWLKINAVPNRAGILVMGPPDATAPTAQNNRNNGFRFFREDVSGKQRFKLNVGNGTADTWFDGGAAADVDPAIGKWVHFAFTISNSECVVYIDGQVVKKGAFDGINWDGCDILSIMSGAPRFTGWDHLSDLSYMDELRLFNRALSQEEIQGIITDESGKDFTYIPKYSGEIFYMPFEDSYLEYVSQKEPTVVGTPGFASGKVGKAYAGATDSYLTFPTDGLQGNQFSAVFWTKINSAPDRAGILIMGPEDTANPTAQNNRGNGFRFFREGSATSQQFKLNVGLGGTSESWNDGGKVDPTAGDWVHMAFTISGTKSVIYINGELARESAFTGGIKWDGCDILSIMSGVPRFTGWNHFSDLSLMDELRLFNKALTQDEIKTIINDEK
jgi:hypothetical protein